jgi:hypothetical protein
MLVYSHVNHMELSSILDAKDECKTKKLAKSIELSDNYSHSSANCSAIAEIIPVLFSVPGKVMTVLHRLP